MSTRLTQLVLLLLTSMVFVMPALAQETEALDTAQSPDEELELGFGGLGTLPVDGMVGQVNGQAIYAKSVFEDIGPILKARGRDLSSYEFGKVADEQIRGKLTEIVTTKLLLSEAERDMNPQEEQRLNFYLDRELQEVIRLYGLGSRILAGEEVQRQYDKTLDEFMDEKRSTILIRRYLELKINPLIVIRRRDISKFYESNKDLFNRPAERELRQIVASNQSAAKLIEQALKDGESFIDVAEDGALNTHRPLDAGKMSRAAEGDKIFDDETINAAVLKLKEGEHTGRLEWTDARGVKQITWIYVESYKEGRSTSLADAQLEIEAELRRREFQRLTDEFRTDAFEKGNFTNIDEMADKLKRVAIARYFDPDFEERRAASENESVSERD